MIDDRRKSILNKINATVIIFLFCQLTTAIWWASSLDRRVSMESEFRKDQISTLEKRMDRVQLSIDSRLQCLDNKMTDIIKLLTEHMTQTKRN
jgi:hypothetical protein